MVQPAITESAAAGAEPARSPKAASAAIEFLSWAAAMVTGLLLALAGLVLWRRLAGALDTPLPAPVLAGAGVLVAALAAGARLAWRRQFPRRPPLPADRVIELMPGAALVLLGIAWSLPGTSVYGLAILWGVILVEEIWTFRGVVGGRSSRPRPLAEAGQPAAPLSEVPPSATVPLPLPHTAHPAEDVLQQVTRTREADGTDRLGGWLRARFGAGQRTESVHLAFCPPFERAPRLEVNQRGGPGVRVKTGQLLPHGARLDLKLAATAERPEWVLLEFTAEEKGVRS